MWHPKPGDSYCTVTNYLLASPGPRRPMLLWSRPDPKEVLEFVEAELGPSLGGVRSPLLVKGRRHDLALALLELKDTVLDSVL